MKGKKRKKRKQNSNCPKLPQQKQFSPSLQHLEEVIITVDPNYSDNNTTAQIVLQKQTEKKWCY